MAIRWTLSILAAGGAAAAAKSSLEAVGTFAPSSTGGSLRRLRMLPYEVAETSQTVGLAALEAMDLRTYKMLPIGPAVTAATKSYGAPPGRADAIDLRRCLLFIITAPPTSVWSTISHSVGDDPPILLPVYPRAPPTPKRPHARSPRAQSFTHRVASNLRVRRRENDPCSIVSRTPV